MAHKHSRVALSIVGTIGPRHSHIKITYLFVRINRIMCLTGLQ